MRLTFLSLARQSFPSNLKGLALGALALASTLIASPASAQQLWADEFNSGAFNASGSWGVYQPWQMLGRTQFGLSPTLGSQSGVSYARMPLRTYNDGYDPSAPRTQSSEIFTKQTFKVGTGVEFEARLRGVNVPRGVVFGLYAYNEKGLWPNGYLKEEIDFEVLSNKSTNQFWSNIWNDWNNRYGYNNGVHNSDGLVTVPNMDYTAWTTYTARWYPDRVEWYVNGVLARTSKNIVPDDPLSVHFNMWTPDSSWGTAYDPILQPTKDAAKSVACYLDVDYVRVKKLPIPTKGVWSDGDGLRANYYPKPNFVETPVSRVDPTLYNDWRNYSPDINIPNDNFSARWTGSIASPFTENVTLTLRADDGVRLYLDNKLLIDDWIITSAKDRSVTVAMKAGVKVPIRVEYFEGTGGASVMFFWSSPSMPKVKVPQCQLFAGDTTPPVLTMTSPGPGYSYRSVNAVGTVTDAGDGVASVKAVVQRSSDGLFWNGSVWGGTPISLSATLSGNNWNLSLASLSNGQYIITVSALDKAGNTASLPARDFWIDTVVPSATIVTPQNGTSYPSLASASGTATDSGPGVASVSTAFKRNVDGFWWNGSSFVSAYTEVKATLTGTTWKLNFPSPAAGGYIFYVRSYDYAGNIGTWVQSGFSIAAAAPDTTPPSASLSTPVNGSRYTSLTSATGTANDGGSGIDTVSTAMMRSSDGFWWNGSSFVSAYTEVKATLTGTTWKLNFPSPAAGGYIFYVRSRDKAGNYGTWVQANFTLGAAAISNAAPISSSANGF